MAAFFLHDFNQAFEHGDVFYVRFMDDILILAPSRWKLRRAVATPNTVLTRLGLQKHPA
jgi:RNA-directed DNA polymerase